MLMLGQSADSETGLYEGECITSTLGIAPDEVVVVLHIEVHAGSYGAGIDEEVHLPRLANTLEVLLLHLVHCDAVFIADHILPRVELHCCTDIAASSGHLFSQRRRGDHGHYFFAHQDLVYD